MVIGVLPNRAHLTPVLCPVNRCDDGVLRKKRMPMKPRFGVALVLTAGFGMMSASAALDPTTDPVNVHLAAAQRAAGLDYPGLLARVCIVPPTGGDAAAGR